MGISNRIDATDTRLSRREFIGSTGSAGALFLAGCVAPTVSTETPSQSPSTDHSSPEIEKWLDEVPRPGVVDPVGTKDGNLGADDRGSAG